MGGHGLDSRTDRADDESVPVGKLAQLVVPPIDGLAVEGVVVLNGEARRVDHAQLLDVVLRDAAEAYGEGLVVVAHYSYRASEGS